MKKIFNREIFHQTTFLILMFACVVTFLYWMVFKADRSLHTNTFQSTFNPAEITQTSSKINAEFDLTWKEKGIRPTSQASWLLQVRRIGMALCGAPPSLEHLRWLESLPERKRVPEFTEHLLKSKSCADYLAERLARPWLGTHEGALIVYRGRRFRFWLSRQIQDDVPYDQIIFKILTAKGLWNQNPEVNFFTAQCDQNQDNQLDTIRLTGRISRNFMGMRLDCLQCHDDFMGTTRVGSETEELEGTQVDFHHIAAFFSKTQVNLLGVQERADGKEYLYQLLGQEDPQKIEPKVPFPLEERLRKKQSSETEITLSNREKLVPTQAERNPLLRREQLANWLTSRQNRPFARSMVNRVWGLMFGKPLHDPVDDIPLYGPFPPAMEKLTDFFIESNYDIKKLIRLIIRTKPFKLRSDADFTLTQSHQSSWACFPITKVRPEQMCGSVYQSASLTRVDDTSSTLTQLIRYGEQNDFLKRFGDLGDEEFGQSNQTVSQRLLLFNGEMIQKRLGAIDAPFSSYQSTANLAKDRETLVKTIFLLVLTRKPTLHEMTYFRENLPEDASIAAEDLAWVLTNCNESLWNH